jgi:hypothetical protein
MNKQSWLAVLSCVKLGFGSIHAKLQKVVTKNPLGVGKQLGGTR